jgi:hypothetical protein
MRQDVYWPSVKRLSTTGVDFAEDSVKQGSLNHPDLDICLGDVLRKAVSNALNPYCGHSFLAVARRVK